MKKILLFFSLFTTTLLFAQNPVELPLWPDKAPNNSRPSETEQNYNNEWVTNITVPTLTIFPASQPNGMAIIMCPGGAYSGLAMRHEGLDMASWLNAQGITYAVLKYRMPNGHNEIPLSDAEQAIRLIREHAAEWGVNPQRVGIMGASAGGHLAASLATLYSSDKTRPDFQILFYPVISMQPGITHGGSRTNLLGENPSQELEQKYSLERQVSARTPQAFIMLSSDDDAVPPINGIGYFLALRDHKVPASLHAYPTGGHGWGFRDNFPYKRQWTEELEKWLREGLVFPGL
ncbi:alpha/beta hydrolase [Bacteroides muris (ex Fokt et al. 2023)]|uniref:Alpha/beta hydrolase n=1 Tax=Bacteroides muris (ex Fokt et al. 2023) TaxID=2937417 RepID=A0A9X2NUJ2_9BACE|nr:alpha/beta hydrolase [Bacteroides muris (ex Fokt et al. 2023)]MCR6505496.1 alpha/beta hydrolase [Bacteroides muris (ex Fokt et al. 2023)]